MISTQLELKTKTPSQPSILLACKISLIHRLRRSRSSCWEGRASFITSKRYARYCGNICTLKKHGLYFKPLSKMPKGKNLIFGSKQVLSNWRNLRPKSVELTSMRYTLEISSKQYAFSWKTTTKKSQKTSKYTLSNMPAN